MSEAEESEEPTGPERGLDGHLELLRAAPPAAPADLERRVMVRVRWQRAFRTPLMRFGHFVGSVRDGIRLLLLPPKAR